MTSFIGKFFSNKIFMKINENLHSKMVNRVLNTHLRFFEKNTSGTILNRFSKDIATLDIIVFNFLEMIDYILKCAYSVILIVLLVPWLLLVIFFVLIYLIRLRRLCLLSTRDPIRLKFSLVSPVNSLI